MGYLQDVWRVIFNTSKNRTPPPEGQEGSSGTIVFSGEIQDTIVTDLSGNKRYPEFAKMRNSDVIQAVRTAVLTQLLATEFMVQPYVEGGDVADVKEYDQDVANKVQEWLHNIPGTPWEEFLRQAGDAYFEGCALFELVWGENEDGDTIIQKLDPRLAETVEKWLYDKEKNFAGIFQRVEGDLAFVGEIEADRLMRITWEQRGYDFRGRGLFLTMHGSWQNIETLERIYNTAMSRTGTGVITIAHPKMPQDQLAQLISLAKDYAEGRIDSLVVPEDVTITVTSIDEPSTIHEMILQYIRRIFSAANCEHIALGSGSSGSFALGQVQSEEFDRSLNAIAKVIVSAVQRRVCGAACGLQLSSRDELPDADVHTSRTFNRCASRYIRDTRRRRIAAANCRRD